MPGRRNLALERARHAASQPARMAALHAMLVTQLPDRDRALIGWPSILAYLHRLGLRRLNGRPVSARMVTRWRHAAACPVLGGRWTLGRCYTPPLSSSFALTAWLLTQLSTDERPLAFRVSLTSAPAVDGNAPEQSDIAFYKPRRAHRRLAA